MTHRIDRSAIGTWLFVLHFSPLVAAQAVPEPADPDSTPPSAQEQPVEAAPAEVTEAPASPEEEATPPVAEEPASQPVLSSRDDIVVTGSRIRGSSFGRTAAPVDIIDRSHLDGRGSSNLADAVQYLTAAQGGGIEGGVGGGAAGSTASTINLRGLGVGTTLLLVNGRRVNPTGYDTLGIFADFSLIPMAAVERIDILKAGASAIYGADAVGGVVNIITRRAWNGMRLEFDDKATQKFDLNEYNGSASFASNFERGRVMAAASYFHRDGLMVSDRDFPPDKFRRANGYPGSFTMGAVTLPDPACGTPRAPGSTVIMTMGMPTGCSTNYRNDAILVSDAERVNAFGSGEFDLNEHLTAFGELNVSRFRGDQPIFNLPINPPPVIVPADHIDNTFHQVVTYRAAPGPGRRLITTSDDSFRGVVGLKGDLGGIAGESLLRDWQWELSTSIGISRFLRTIDDNLRGPLQRALNSCSDPAHTENCFNPFFSATDGTGTANSRAVVERISGREIEISDHALQSYNAGVNGSLAELPGGDLGFALGGEVRREWLVVDLDHDQNQGELLSLGLSSDFTIERATYGGYLELRAPLLTWLELQAAGRVEYYTDTDSASLSPFAGVTVTPLRGLLLRGNLSRSFRAPTVLQTYPGKVGIPTYVRFNDAYQLVSTQYSGNSNLIAETAITLSTGFQWTLNTVLKVNADFWYYDFKDRIQSEVAQSLVDRWAMQGMPASTKVIYDPATKQIGEIYSTRVNVPGSIITDGIDFGIGTSIDGTSFGGSPDDFGRFSLSLQGTYTLTYTVPRGQASAAQRADCDGTDDGAACSVLGARNSDTVATGSPPSLPRLKLNLPLVWGIGGHTVSLVGHYVSGVKDDVIADPGTFSNGGEIPAWITFDLQYAFALANVIGKEFTLRVGCENLFDRKPPFVNGITVGFLGDLHDPRGRMLYAKLGAEF